MAFSFFVLSLLFLGAWYLMHRFVPYEKLEKTWMVLGLKGVAGAFFAAFVCTLLAIIICYNPWFALPVSSEAITIVSWEDSRLYMCLALILGFNMMGLPIGFLFAIAKSNKELSQLQK